jgi:hypothetical protein
LGTMNGRMLAIYLTDDNCSKRLGSGAVRS